MLISEIFITLIYQPFLNILVGFYWILDILSGGHPDMGVAVILLTILIRLLMLPMSLSGHRSEDERREITRKIKEIEEIYVAEPIKIEIEKQKILKKSRKVIVSELIGLIIQVAIALMLWKIFKTGLTGGDLHLIYPFMPKVAQPFNLLFLGKFELSHASLNNWHIDWSVMQLNFMQSFLIFVLETISMYSSPYHVSKSEVVRMQLVLPLVSFIIFLGLPAGKKLFVITTLIFSIILTIYKVIARKFEEYKDKKIQEEKDKEAGNIPEEKIVVDIK